jgi:hypothetical protein
VKAAELFIAVELCQLCDPGARASRHRMPASSNESGLHCRIAHIGPIDDEMLGFFGKRKKSPRLIASAGGKDDEAITPRQVEDTA